MDKQTQIGETLLHSEGQSIANSDVGFCPWHFCPQLSLSVCLCLSLFSLPLCSVYKIYKHFTHALTLINIPVYLTLEKNATVLFEEIV